MQRSGVRSIYLKLRSHQKNGLLPSCHREQHALDDDLSNVRREKDEDPLPICLSIEHSKDLKYNTKLPIEGLSTVKADKSVALRGK